MKNLKILDLKNFIKIIARGEYRTRAYHGKARHIDPYARLPPGKVARLDIIYSIRQNSIINKLFPMFIVWRVELLARVADNDLANINPSPFAPILRSVKVVFTIKALQIPFYCLKIVNGSKMNLDRKFRGLLWALCRVILRQFPIPPLSPIIFCEMLRLLNFAVSD